MDFFLNVLVLVDRQHHRLSPMRSRYDVFVYAHVFVDSNSVGFLDGRLLPLFNEAEEGCCEEREEEHSSDGDEHEDDHR